MHKNYDGHFEIQDGGRNNGRLTCVLLLNERACQNSKQPALWLGRPDPDSQTGQPERDEPDKKTQPGDGTASKISICTGSSALYSSWASTANPGRHYDAVYTRYRRFFADAQSGDQNWFKAIYLMNPF